MYLTLYWTYHIKHGFLPSFKLIHFNVRIKMEHQLVKLPSNTSGCWILYELEHISTWDKITNSIQVGTCKINIRVMVFCLHV